MVSRGVRYPLTHDIVELNTLVEAVDPAMAQAARPGERLTEFATVYRYPGAPPLPLLDETQRWVETARAIVAEAERRIP